MYLRPFQYYLDGQIDSGIQYGVINDNGVVLFDHPIICVSS